MQPVQHAYASGLKDTSKRRCDGFARSFAARKGPQRTQTYARDALGPPFRFLRTPVALDLNWIYIGVFATQEEAARAVDAAIRRAGLEDQRNTNSVDANGPLVPKYSAAQYPAAQP